MPRMASSVDLPAPDGPMKVTNSPSAMSSVMRRKTNVCPAAVLYDFSTSRSEIKGVIGNAPGSCVLRLGGHDVLVDHAAVEEANGARGLAGVVVVVGDHADGRAGLVQLLEELH